VYLFSCAGTHVSFVLLCFDDKLQWFLLEPVIAAFKMELTLSPHMLNDTPSSDKGIQFFLNWHPR
jgi:hypothetical protein